MNSQKPVTIARMDQWPVWQRWGIWLAGWVLYLGSFWWLFVAGGLATRGLALVGICVGLVLLSYSSRAVLNERMRGIDHKYVRAVLPAFLVYIVLMLYVFPREAHIVTPWLKAVVAVLPALPLMFVAWAAVRYINRCDEMERLQHLEAAGIAVVVVGLCSMVLGFLAVAKLIVVDAAIALLLVFPALCIVYGFACGWLKWRTRAR